MANINNFKKAINEIGQLLAQDKKLCSLLYNDSADALDLEANLSIDDLINKEYICLYPPLETAIQDIKRNSFLIILINRIDFHGMDDNSDGNIVILVSTDKEHVMLDNNKNRLLELVNRICVTLDQVKLSSAGQLELEDVEWLTLTNFRAGYKISFSISDQEGKEAEI